MEDLQLKAICEPTRIIILGLLSQSSLSNTELYDKLKRQNNRIVYRESVFKALKKLKAANLIKREYHEKIGYRYSLNFKELKIEGTLVIKIK